MLKQTKRGFTEGIINVTIKEGRNIYNITASARKEENGKYDLMIYRNGKLVTLNKNVCSSVKGINRKIRTTADFYNMENNVKRLATLEQERVALEKRHKKNLRYRDTLIKKDLQKIKKSRSKVKSVKIDKDLENILISMSAVK